MKVAAEAAYCEYLLYINRGLRVENEYNMSEFFEPISAMWECGNREKNKNLSAKYFTIL